MTAQWVNDAAREARLQRIDNGYAEQVSVLKDVSP
jgi:phosphonate transport system substrate-binding protein